LFLLKWGLKYANAGQQVVFLASLKKGGHDLRSRRGEKKDKG